MLIDGLHNLLLRKKAIANAYFEIRFPILFILKALPRKNFKFHCCWNISAASYNSTALLS